MRATGPPRGSLALAAGSTIAGLLAYVFFALTTRGLGATEAAPVAVLWSYWAFAGAALTFPVQHWITRTAGVHGESAVARELPRIGLVVVALSIAAGAVAAVARDPLFQRTDLWFPALVVLVTLGSALIGIVRGTLSARRRFVAVAAGMVAENALRCLTAGLLVAADVRGAVAYGLSLVGGNLVVLLWPTAFLLRRDRPDQARTGRPFAYLAGAGFAQVVHQVVLTGGPVALALAHGSSAEVTTLFAALALFRAPYLVALGVMPQVTSRVTTLVLEGRTARLRRLRRLLVRATIAGTLVAALAGALAGPWLLRLVFGPEVQLGEAMAGLIAVGCTLAVANLVAMVSALAHDQSAAVARAWAAAIAAAATTFVVLATSDPLTRVVCAFVAAEATGFAALMLVDGRRQARSPG